MAKILETRVMDDSPNGDLTANMVNVQLPLTGVPDTPMIRTVFNYKLLVEGNVSAPCFMHNGSWWTRASAQVWNEVGF